MTHFRPLREHIFGVQEKRNINIKIDFNRNDILETQRLSLLPSKTMSSDESRKNNNLPKPANTLDLHGCSKSEAISRTTDFLERSNLLLNSENAWVVIITGSGAHSMHGRKLCWGVVLSLMV